MRRRFINKRRKIFFKTKLFIFVVILIILIFSVYFNFNKLSYTTLNLIQEYSNKYNYNLTKIEISGLNYIEENEIYDFFKKFKNHSIFLIPVNKIASEIKKNKWIQQIDIKNDYKNTLSLFIKEEIPMGIYDNNNKKILFSKNLVVLEILNFNHQYEKLITFYGENSINNSINLFINIDDEIKKMIETATYIENRRWNIKLKNMIILKLPEAKINEAIDNYKNIYANFSNKDLKDIEFIDLRISKQAIIKYKNKLNN